jgi:hypothetical protein
MRSPACPNCGYDLSGISASWKTSCPLEGRCSECGGSFWWGSLFTSPHAHIRLFDAASNPGLFEIAGTCALAILRPGAFWRLAAIQHPPRRGPLALAALLLPYVGLVLLFAVSLPLSLVSGLITAVFLDPSTFYEPFLPLAWMPGEWHCGTLETAFSPWLLLPMATFLSTPLALLILSQSLSRAGIGRTLALRACIWSLGWAVVVYLPWAACGILIELADQIYYETTGPVDEFAMLIRIVLHIGRIATTLFIAPVAIFIWYRLAFRAFAVRGPSRAAAAITGVSFLLGACLAVVVYAAMH